MLGCRSVDRPSNGIWLPTEHIYDEYIVIFESRNFISDFIFIWILEN